MLQPIGHITKTVMKNISDIAKLCNEIMKYDMRNTQHMSYPSNRPTQ